jgi:hypothetical protein
MAASAGNKGAARDFGDVTCPNHTEQELVNGVAVGP